MTKTLEELQGEGEKALSLVIAQCAPFTMLEQYKDADFEKLNDFIRQEREKAFNLGQLSGVELAKEKVSEYFKGLILVPYPEKTGLNIITNLTNLQVELGK